jgi:hypothetical protein
VYRVTATAGNGGAIDPAGEQAANAGQSLAFTLTPEAGHQLAAVSGCEGVLEGDTYTTAPVARDCTVEASFAALSYTMTATVGSGSGTVTPTTAVVSAGNQASFTLSPATGYRIDGASGCGGALSGNRYTTAPATADCTVTANFARLQYTVSTSAGSGGSISPTSRTLYYGQSGSFTLTPDSGHEIAGASGCNGSLSGSTYTTGAVVGNCTVSASFQAVAACPVGEYLTRWALLPPRVVLEQLGWMCASTPPPAPPSAPCRGHSPLRDR